MYTHSSVCVYVSTYKHISQKPKIKPLKSQTVSLELVISNVVIDFRDTNNLVITRSIWLNRCFNAIICKL